MVMSLKTHHWFGDEFDRTHTQTPNLKLENHSQERLCAWGLISNEGMEVSEPFATESVSAACIPIPTSVDALWLPMPCACILSTAARTFTSTCELCKEDIGNDELVVLVGPGGKKVFERAQLDIREAKQSHMRCMPSWKAHPSECKPCIDWHKKRKMPQRIQLSILPPSS